jgi:phosphotransferase system  glucose/maltose/N-acetylglucosamine-specific IIC component
LACTAQVRVFYALPQQTLTAVLTAFLLCLCSGLTNMIFMPPGSLVVEITGQFDGRTMPLCGYHGGLAAVFGLHHYVYYYDWKGGERLDAAQVAAEAAQFWRFLSK